MPENTDKPENKGKMLKLVMKLGLASGVALAWVVLSRFLPLIDWMLMALEWVRDLGVWGPLAYSLLYIPACLLLFPDLIINAAAGMIWGVGLGSVAVTIGRGIGSLITFLLVRLLAYRWMERRMADNADFAAIEAAIAREGFKLVVLVRLCPIFPVNVLNFALGLTQVSWRSYFFGTMVGMLPRTLVVAYAGSGAKSLGDLAAGKLDWGASQQIIFWGGFLLTVVVSAFIIRIAQRALHAATNPVA